MKLKICNHIMFCRNPVCRHSKPHAPIIRKGYYSCTSVRDFPSCHYSDVKSHFKRACNITVRKEMKHEQVQ